MENIIYHVGVSGGKDSTAVLLWMIHKSGIPHHKINVTFCDTGNEHEWTYEHIKWLSENIFPIQTLTPPRTFFELALHKHRFPSTKVRFCTQFLKIYPTHEHLSDLKFFGCTPIAVSGVRANESEERSKLSERDLIDIGKGDDLWFCEQWRPLLKWTLDDVLEIHREYNAPLNPLYAIGAMRVGCFPCIMSRKSEIRNIAIRFPERITMIRNAEQNFEKHYGRYSSFFPRTIVPLRFRSKEYVTKEGKAIKIATIDDVVRWSMTGHRARGRFDIPKLFNNDPITCVSGFCE